jgi:hypothetical protein
MLTKAEPKKQDATPASSLTKEEKENLDPLLQGPLLLQCRFAYLGHHLQKVTKNLLAVLRAE